MMIGNISKGSSNVLLIARFQTLGRAGTATASQHNSPAALQSHSGLLDTPNAYLQQPECSNSC